MVTRLFGALLVCAAMSPAAVLSLNEGFDDVSTLTASGWFITNASNPVGTTSWFQGVDEIFAAHSGGPTSYAAANFNSTGTIGANPGTISTWMMTPELDLSQGGFLTFYSRTVDDPIFPDRLEVLLSTNGASTSIAGFTVPLVSINTALTLVGYPSQWTLYQAVVGPFAGTGRIAFHYSAPDAGPSAFAINSDYIGVDSVSFTQIPEPGTSLLIAAGFGALALLRWRRA